MIILVPSDLRVYESLVFVVYGPVPRAIPGAMMCSVLESQYLVMGIPVLPNHHVSRVPEHLQYRRLTWYHGEVSIVCYQYQWLWRCRAFLRWELYHIQYQRFSLVPLLYRQYGIFFVHRWGGIAASEPEPLVSLGGAAELIVEALWCFWVPHFRTTCTETEPLWLDNNSVEGLGSPFSQALTGGIWWPFLRLYPLWSWRLWGWSKVGTGVPWKLKCLLHKEEF